MIIFQNITKRFGDNVVLEDINLEIEGGEFVVITGKSGVGKTTLINMLIGLAKASFGMISVDGYDITKFQRGAWQEYRRRLGVVFQDYKLLPRKTAYENVAFALEATGANDGEIQEKVPKLLEKVGLKGKEKNFPAQLSGGEKQRVSIARALVHKPNLIIADEPTGNLDRANSMAIVDLLKEINDEGITVILATHDENIVKYLNTRVVEIKDGIIAQ